MLFGVTKMFVKLNQNITGIWSKHHNCYVNFELDPLHLGSSPFGEIKTQKFEKSIKLLMVVGPT